MRISRCFHEELKIEFRVLSPLQLESKQQNEYIPLFTNILSQSLKKYLEVYFPQTILFRLFLIKEATNPLEHQNNAWRLLENGSIYLIRNSFLTCFLAPVVSPTLHLNSCRDLTDPHLKHLWRLSFLSRHYDQGSHLHQLSANPPP